MDVWMCEDQASLGDVSAGTGQQENSAAGHAAAGPSHATIGIADTGRKKVYWPGFKRTSATPKRLTIAKVSRWEVAGSTLAPTH